MLPFVAPWLSFLTGGSPLITELIFNLLRNRPDGRCYVSRGLRGFYAHTTSLELVQYSSRQTCIRLFTFTHKWKIGIRKPSRIMVFRKRSRANVDSDVLLVSVLPRQDFTQYLIFGLRPDRICNTMNCCIPWVPGQRSAISAPAHWLRTPPSLRYKCQGRS